MLLTVYSFKRCQIGKYILLQNKIGNYKLHYKLRHQTKIRAETFRIKLYLVLREPAAKARSA